MGVCTAQEATPVSSKRYATPLSKGAATLAALGFALYWPQLRSFEFTALLGHYGNPAVTMRLMLLVVLASLACFGILVARFRSSIEPRLFARDKRMLAAGCTGSLGAVLTLLAPHSGILASTLFALGACTIASGYLFLTLSWSATFVAMGAVRSLAIMACSYVLASCIPLTDLLPLPVGAIIAALSPALSSLAWFGGFHKDTDTAGGCPLSVRTMFGELPLRLILVIALFLLVGRFVLGTIVEADTQITLPVRLADAATGVLLFVAVASVVQKGQRGGWSTAIKLAWAVLTTLFVAGMLLLVARPTGLLSVGEGIVAAGFNGFEFVLWTLLIGIAFQRHLSITVVFGCVFTFCKLLPVLCGKLLVPKAASAFGWTENSGQLVALMLVLALLLIFVTIFFLTFEGFDLEQEENDGDRRPESFGKVSGNLIEMYGLTEREVDVVHLILNGFSYQRVADELGVSLSTVQSHVKKTYRKLGVHTRNELIDTVREME